MWSIATYADARKSGRIPNGSLDAETSDCQGGSRNYLRVVSRHALHTGMQNLRRLDGESILPWGGRVLYCPYIHGIRNLLVD